jgi:hypothetical protein
LNTGPSVDGRSQEATCETEIIPLDHIPMRSWHCDAEFGGMSGWWDFAASGRCGGRQSGSLGSAIRIALTPIRRSSESTRQHIETLIISTVTSLPFHLPSHPTKSPDSFPPILTATLLEKAAVRPWKHDLFHHVRGSAAGLATTREQVRSA